MMQPFEPVALPQSTLWMLDLDQPLPVVPTLRVPVAFMRAGPEVAYAHMDHTVNQDELHFVQGMMASVLSIGN